MDTQRLVLLAAFFMVSLMLWQSWDVQVNPQKYSQTTKTDSTQNNQPTEAKLSTEKAKDLPNLPQDGSVSYQSPNAQNQQQLASKRVIIKTDLFEMEIDTKGADIKKALLLQYPIDVNHNKNPVILMDENSETFLISQTGILNKDNNPLYAPDHNSTYSIEKYEYSMGGENKLEVTFKWISEDSKMEIRKTYVFTRGVYKVKLNQEIINHSEQNINGYAYRQFQRNNPGKKSMIIHTYTGGMLYRDGGGFEKYSFSDMEDEVLDRTMKNGWAAMIEHYFLTAWIPSSDQKQHYYSRVYQSDNYSKRYIIGLTSAAFSIEPKQSLIIKDLLFLGPKLQTKLSKITKNLDDTVDYGFLSVIAHPIFWILENIHKYIGNWGWSIILLTLFIKLIFYKLSAYSYRSMAQMRKLGPKLKAMQEQYKDNAQAKNQAMMKMYKKEKINPLGGCLPILVQIPVFISLYWVLLESVELRQADFILWLNNLSAPDPYYVLPLIMGITMFIQQKLNPAPTDPIQAKVMMMLPVIFTVFFAFFPSGLVLYWVTNNVLSIAQQWNITRQIDKS
ncbi:MAG: membrane protein insertase YidC [Pseudomonadota bacterium]